MMISVNYIHNNHNDDNLVYYSPLDVLTKLKSNWSTKTQIYIIIIMYLIQKVSTNYGIYT